MTTTYLRTMAWNVAIDNTPMTTETNEDNLSEYFQPGLERGEYKQKALMTP